MTSPAETGSINRATIVQDLIRIVSDMTQDWDLDYSGGLSEETRLIGELGFQSIDVVMLVGEIHRHYRRRSLPFERLLLVDGRYAEEIRIGAVADFLHVELNGAKAPEGGPPQQGGSTE